MKARQVVLYEMSTVDNLTDAIRDALTTEDRDRALELLNQLRETVRHAIGLVINAR